MEEPPDAIENSENELDFQEPIEVNIRKRKKTSYVEDDDSDEEDILTTTCPICQTYWTNSGTHTIVHLKCGHSFGKSCIDSYVKEMNSLCSYAACPKCRNPIAKSDIRRIWPNKLIPESEEELKSLKKAIEESKRMLAELTEQQTTLKSQITHYKQELENMNPEEELVELVKHSQSTQPPSQSSQRNFELQHEIRFPNESYGVIDLNPTMDMAVTGAFNSMTRKFGLRKFNLLDPQITEFVAIEHKNKIRDIKHSTKEPLILSTGDDMSLKLTSMKNNIVILSYHLPQPSLSCAFDDKNSNMLYCGLASGSLMIFDIRNTRNYVHRLDKPQDAFPIKSIVPHHDSIICVDRRGYYNWFLNEEQEYEYSPIDTILVEGRSDIFSVDFKHNMFMTSTHNISPEYTYTVSHLQNVDDNEYYDMNGNYSMEVDWSYTAVDCAGIPEHRNTIFQRDDQAYICYYEKNQINIRNAVNEIQSIPVDGRIVDIQHTNIDGSEFITASAESSILLYKFQ